GHADRLGALLGEGRGVEDQHGVGLAQLGPDLGGQLAEQGAVVPAGLADELLEALALAVVQVGDGLGVLAGQLGQQALDAVPRVGPLLGRAQGPDERLQERFQPGHDATEQSRRDLSVLNQLVQPDALPSLHRLLRSPDHPPEGLYCNDLRPSRLGDTAELVFLSFSRNVAGGASTGVCRTPRRASRQHLAFPGWVGRADAQRDRPRRRHLPRGATCGWGSVAVAMPGAPASSSVATWCCAWLPATSWLGLPRPVSLRKWEGCP